MFLDNTKVRAWLYQVIVIALIGFALYTIFENVQANLSRQGIATGFSFLHDTAGFDVSTSLIAYDESDTYSRVFVVGLLNTLLVSVLGIIVASVLGFILGIARLSDNWLISKLSLAYIELFRNIPLLLQLFFWYFAVLRTLPHPRQSIAWFSSIFINNRGVYLPFPQLSQGLWLVIILLLIATLICGLMFFKHSGLEHNLQKLKLWGYGFAGTSVLCLSVILIACFVADWDIPSLRGFNFKGGITLVPELLSLWFALSIYTAAFIAEIVRAGIIAVSKGQTEAAHSLGLSAWQTLRLIIFPQSMEIIIPPLTNQYLNLTKNSSLAAAIAYPDLVSVFAGTTLNQTGQAIEVIAITMSVYLCISLLISLFMNFYQKHTLHWNGGR